VDGHPANSWSAIIPQPVMGVPGGMVDDVLEQNENDALTVNVWTPAADGAKRPVLVWVSCGAFTFSSGADPFTDGERLARKHDVVVATFNCRPGLLGFLYLGDVLGGDYSAGTPGSSTRSQPSSGCATTSGTSVAMPTT
jgi:para-nitrobenzyl esterase